MSAEAGRKAEILLIEDEAMVRETIVQMLGEESYSFRHAENGDEGVRAMEGLTADLVISDIIMPKREGIETIIEIRRRWPATRILAISGGGYGGRTDFLDSARKLGADAALAKPFSAAEMVETVERLLATPGSG